MSTRRWARGRRRDEAGAVAVLVAVLALVIFGLAAIAVDTTSLANKRQLLHDSIDAAAHAGAFALPSGDASAAATQFAASNGSGVTPTVDLFCVVGSTLVSGSYQVDSNHIPSTCMPGPAPYTAAAYPGLRCNAKICAIPCFTSQGDQCNTIRVSADKPVPFGFAPVLGIDQGSTGTVSSAACKGACGSLAPNPIDFAVVGDRTGSMGAANISALKGAIQGLLEYLTPAQHRVALGTIGRSQAGAAASCPSTPSTDRATGPWFPVGLSDDYDLTDVDPPSATPNLNAGSPLVKAVGCLGASGTGTYLASPMRAARELLTGPTARPSPVRKGIIFMTDGEPNESTSPGGGYPYSSDGTVACNNAKTEATTAKNAGILVVTIAFRLADVRCNGGTTPLVTTTLASMASPRADGSASLDDGGGAGSGCNTTAEVDGENGDGDYFFCTPTAAQLEPIFRTAATTISGSIRLLQLP